MTDKNKTCFMNMLRRITASGILVCTLCMCLTACANGRAPCVSIITDAVNAKDYLYMPGENENCLVIGIASGTVHLFRDCRYAQRISEKNKRYMQNDAQALQRLTESGYKICSVCEERYYEGHESDLNDAVMSSTSVYRAAFYNFFT